MSLLHFREGMETQAEKEFTAVKTILEKGKTWPLPKAPAAQGWARLWSLTRGGFPASLVSFEWSVHVGAVTLVAVSREWGHTRNRLVSALQGHPGHPGEQEVDARSRLQLLDALGVPG